MTILELTLIGNCCEHNYADADERGVLHCKLCGWTKMVQYYQPEWEFDLTT